MAEAAIESVQNVCARLADHGWAELLLAHGLDITADDLTTELARELSGIRRDLPGFEDFADEGRRGIEPGLPAQSLLYHALASPAVTHGVGGEVLGAFPGLAELDVVENYVYAAARVSLADVRTRARHLAGMTARGESGRLGIVVFASEYRTAISTVHRLHAEMCYSRTGVARVGTSDPHWSGRRRSFMALKEDDPAAIRVLPARYSPYLAVRLPGDPESFGPLAASRSDAGRHFWVPLHKLFDGTECLQGLDLEVQLESLHVNEKLRRFHRAMAERGFDTGWDMPEIDRPPFRFTDRLAELSGDDDLGPGVVVPVVHDALVEEAEFEGERLTFRVPRDYNMTLLSSLLVGAESGNNRPSPEYVHARHKVVDGEIVDLNEERDVSRQVGAGDYDAVHYLDFTGDGWVRAAVPALRIDVPERVSAYSMVTAPDYFPRVDQGALTDWTRDLPADFGDNLWAVPPDPLSSERLAANINVPNSDFDPEDETVSAIVGRPDAGDGAQRPIVQPPGLRVGQLPDAAAGVFAPGWDTSRDQTDGHEHLASYGLGSPFPEDAKLCAALSTFWPAVAPDTARVFRPNSRWPTISPLTDSEVGSDGTPSWDGVRGPRLIDEGRRVEYDSIDHADYVQNALDGKFRLDQTAQVDLSEYQARVLFMAFAYRILGATPQTRTNWSLASYRVIDEPGPAEAAEFDEARNATGAALPGRVRRFHLYQRGDAELSRDGDRWVDRVEVRNGTVLLMDSSNILARRGSGAWQRVI